jgi:hypothetical protein
VTVEIDTEQVRQLADDLRRHRRDLTSAGGRCVALALPGAGAGLAGEVARLTGLEDSVTRALAAALDGSANVLAITAVHATFVDRFR